MQVEEAFDIVIEDSEAESVRTPRDLIELVRRKVGRTDHARCLTQRAFHKLRTSLVRHAGVPRADIRPDVQMARLLVSEKRTRLLRQILDEVGLAMTPELVRPRWLNNLIPGAAAGAGIVTGFVVSQQSASPHVAVHFLTQVPVLSGFVAAVVSGWLAMRLTRPLRNEFKPPMATVGGFSRWIVAHGPEVAGAPPGPWSRTQVAERVRQIVIDQLGGEERYGEDAQFIDDLGLD